MHLTTSCTGMSKKALYGIQGISQNFLLVCNICVQNNQCDRVIVKIAGTRERADVEAITLCVEEVKQELAQIKTEVKAKPPPEPTKAHIRKCLGKTAQPVNTQKTTESDRTTMPTASVASLNPRREPEENNMTKT